MRWTLNYKHDGAVMLNMFPALSYQGVLYRRWQRSERDGGGVKPDVEVKHDSLPNIAYLAEGARDSNEVM